MTHILAQALRDRINARIILLDLPVFMQEEVDKFLQYVHYYKLKNIEKHLDVFCDYLIYLDQEYTVQLLDSISQNTWDTAFSQGSLSAADMSYYLSVYGKTALDVQWLLPVLTSGFDHCNILTVMMRVKWLFLLTATEFCHASSTRISLYDRLLTSVHA